MELILWLIKKHKIKILLHGNPLDFACKTLGVNNMINNKYSEVFTVSKEDVLEYTAIHGLPHSKRTNKNALGEGFHFFKEDGKWTTFFRERGRIFDKKTFQDDKLAHEYIVTTWLQLCGTGLY